MSSLDNFLASNSSCNSTSKIIRSNPIIGFFDSGIGGMSILNAFVKIRPDAKLYYVADWLYCPYGNQSSDVIIERSECITERLINLGCKIIVVACNTATALAIDNLRAKYQDICFVGMEPAVKPAALATKTNVVGVLATRNTFKGRLFRETSSKYAQKVRIITVVGEGLVEIVESGKFDSTEAEEAIRKIVLPLVDEGADQLVLGCTHYPFLKKTIEKIVGDRVSIIDPSDAVAMQIERMVSKIYA